MGWGVSTTTGWGVATTTAGWGVSTTTGRTVSEATGCGVETTTKTGSRVALGVVVALGDAVGWSVATTGEGVMSDIMGGRGMVVVGLETG